MQYKKTKAQIKKDLYRHYERIGALTLVLGTLAGTVAVSGEARRLLSNLALRPVFAVVEHSSKESEIRHHTMRLDSVLRATPISGE